MSRVDLEGGFHFRYVRFTSNPSDTQVQPASVEEHGGEYATFHTERAGIFQQRRPRGPGNTRHAGCRVNMLMHLK